MELTHRERHILGALVDLFVREPGPISSAQLQLQTRLGVSTATIRNILHSLEDKGLLHQPHTSAGRVPTRAAYQLFVEELGPPSRAPERVMRHLRAQLRELQLDDMQEILARFSKLLAALSNNVSIGFAAADPQPAHIEGVDIVALHGHRFLAVVTFDDGVVRTSSVGLDRPVAAQELAIIAQLIHESVAGCTPAEASKRLDAIMASRVDAAIDLAGAIVRETQQLIHDSPVRTMYVEGATQILGEPEFQDPENLRLLVRFLEEPERLQPLIRNQTATGEPAIYVGEGRAEEHMWPFGLVAVRCDIGGHTGFIGILGPMRMRYAHALSLVSGVADTLRTLERQ